MTAVLLALISIGTQTVQKPTPPKQTKPIPPPIYSTGDHNEKIDEGGVSRTYIARVPTGYDGKRKLPLVLMIHGWTSSAKSVETYSTMGKEADLDGFLLVMPDGLGKPPGWNCGFLNLGGKDADDVKFLTDVLNDVAKKVKVDEKRIYIAGHSNGAMMAYVMGAKLSTKVAAIGVVSGTIGFDQGPRLGVVAAPTSPVSAIIIHGMLDPTVPYDHGQGLLMNCYSAPASAAFWAKANGITTEPIITKAAKGNLEIRDWRSGHIEVELISIANGTHDWPGGLGWSGPETTTGVKAAAQLWAFFAAHHKP